MAAQQPAKVLDERRFPPYGYIHDEWQWDVILRRVPAECMINDVPATPVTWSARIDEIVNEIKEHLWPAFRNMGGAPSWDGKAKAQMHHLTMADLDVMEKLRPKLYQRGSKGNAEPEDRLKDVHKVLFGIEDSPAAGTGFPTLRQYIPGADSALVEKLDKRITSTLVGLGPAPLRFKEFLQRPRPYQMAFVLGRKFEYEFGRSAVTPALPSGHCLQGLIGTCGAYLANRIDAEKGTLEQLKQFAVDFGDRRVYAGVHYPSDNIASWFIALSLCDNLFGGAGRWAKHFIASAIRTHSEVYKELVAVGGDGSPFKAPLEWLHKEAVRPGPDPKFSGELAAIRIPVVP